MYYTIQFCLYRDLSALEPLLALQVKQIMLFATGDTASGNPFFSSMTRQIEQYFHPHGLFLTVG